MPRLCLPRTSEPEISAKSYLAAGKGPVRWLAPEALTASSKGMVVTAASDVYMVGGLLFELLSAGRYVLLL